MSKTAKKISKNISKSKENKNNETDERKTQKALFKILYGILILTIIISILSLIYDGKYIFTDNSGKISDTQIIAGQTFNKQTGTYYVAFYDSTSKTQSLKTTIDGLTTKENIYHVDLSSKFNESIINIKSNKNAETSSDLAINGATIIKIVDGKNAEYIEGYDESVEYLKAIK